MMTVDEMCEVLGIVGVVRYSETDAYIMVNGYLGVKATGHIIDPNGKVVR